MAAILMDRPQTDTIPLCVDLDGTLVKSDLLIEGFFDLLKRKPLTLLMAPWWLLRGKAHLKEKIAEQVELKADLLPYNETLINLLKQEKEKGRVLVLVTAAHRRFADSVASHLSLFDKVHATEGGTNLSAETKRDALISLYGKNGFDYAGNASEDLPVWHAARDSWVVNASGQVRRKAALTARVKVDLHREGGRLRAFLRVIRMHQWLKNMLIFLPLVAAHKVDDTDLVLKALIAFAAFSLCASSVYLLNDLLDLNSDRSHPRKRNRPFAAGSLPLTFGLAMVPLFITLAAILTLTLLPPAFSITLLGYYATSLVYSFWAKGRAVVDVLFLTALYTVRLVAGSAATSISLSFWMLAFSVFLFLGLALTKRYTEMLAVRKAGQSEAAGRGYEVQDMPLILTMGVSSCYLAVLVLALYINSPDVGLLYGHPKVLWLLCPMLLLWICRVWIMTSRGVMHDDPVVFSVKDRISQAIGVGVALILLGAGRNMLSWLPVKIFG
jgi:4-hydroxybenzoate polyprenyltransferase/phosphoserine phosphatase